MADQEKTMAEGLDEMVQRIVDLGLDRKDERRIVKEALFYLIYGNSPIANKEGGAAMKRYDARYCHERHGTWGDRVCPWCGEQETARTIPV